MKNNVFLVCMLLFSISVFGQELKIQGHLIDEEKQDLVAATIRCYLNDTDRKSTRLNSSHQPQSRMPSSA